MAKKKGKNTQKVKTKVVKKPEVVKEPLVTPVVEIPEVKKAVVEIKVETPVLEIPVVEPEVKKAVVEIKVETPVLEIPVVEPEVKKEEEFRAKMSRTIFFSNVSRKIKIKEGEMISLEIAGLFNDKMKNKYLVKI